jgi:hypothetical protein
VYAAEGRRLILQVLEVEDFKQMECCGPGNWFKQTVGEPDKDEVLNFPE